MLPTFVIGLREGLEAALIVGIIAAFLKQQGRRDLLRWVYGGVLAAVLLCLGVGVALKVVSSNLPQKQQEGLETVVGVLAVGMVTYMVIWMRRHSRQLKKELEGLAAAAIGDGGSRAARAMVLMAFLAVLREGFETVVFLLAAFNESGNTADAAGGALAGIAVAVVLGWAIYRGGVRLNLSKFFRATGLVLVLVAAGLVVNALHTAHEAGWLNAGQGGTVDLTWLVQPGSVQSALLTGMLGVQQHPVVIEVAGWLAYLVPVGLYVAWPPSRPVSRRTMVRVWSGVAAAAVAAVAVLAITLPGSPDQTPVTAAGPLTAVLTGPHADTATVRTAPASPAAPAVGAGGQQPVPVALRRTGGTELHGVAVDVYTGSRPGLGAAGRPTTMTFEQAAALNGGRLPLGVVPQGMTPADDSVRLQYADTDALTVWVEPGTGRVVDLSWTETVRATLVGTQVGAVPLNDPVATGRQAFPAATVTAAASAARHDLARISDRSSLLTGVWLAVAVAVVALAAAGLTAAADRRQRGTAVTQTPAPLPTPR
ncbi:FTR1 family protein [Streptacidiphilus sp. PB12-B1b]|uniref:iron uptake transporter permease EfeU n=1 Tax=Streptacidiphilus sp. PB12-B1b TaxID=2705012 RepID=UPI0015FC4443|nr:iron uptake transporter permease EfeU [Streptacidiphilus sp. PB12-B1b]QMU77977.1 FTR1 family protein [Streptacidiphilus sp. PB12-B1b]